MPMPFHCIECNKPISQALNGVCEDCEKKEEE
jgi:NMD protein affecting ribosome stability and mRNA decay